MRPGPPHLRSLLLALCLGSLGCASVSEREVIDETAAAELAISPTLEQPPRRFLKRKVAVLRFSNETKYGAGAFGGALGKPIEEQAADILKARLVESGKVVLIDTEGVAADLDDLGPLKADYAIVGSVSEFGRRTSSETGIFSRSRKQVAYAAVNLRLIDARTGQVLYAEEGAGESEVEAGRTLGVGQDVGYDSSINDKAISTAIAALISNILENMTDAPWQTGILDIDGATVMIAGGDEQGLLVGDQLLVMRRGKLVEDPQYGTMIELPRTQIAKLEVQSFFGSGIGGQGSVCTLITGSLDGEDPASLVIEAEE